MKKGLWLIIVGGIIAFVLVMSVIVYAVSSAFSGASFGGFSWFGNFSLWIGIAVLGLWIYLKHKKSGLAGIAGWVAIAILLFAWFGSTRTSQIAQGTGVVLGSVADSVTSVVTTGNIKTPAQIAAARKAEAEEMKRQQELARIKAEGEARARVAAEVAAARELEATMRDAKAKPCIRRYTDQLNCFTVTFGYNTKYDREALKGYCIVSDPFDALQRTDLGGNQQRFVGQSGLVAQFFDVPIGVWTIEGKEIRCGV